MRGVDKLSVSVHAWPETFSRKNVRKDLTIRVNAFNDIDSQSITVRL